MEASAFTSTSALSHSELKRLQESLSSRYPDAKGVLGSQLGAFVRGLLDNPDLRGRFGGLKQFVAHNFPADIVWRGHQGLDDLYDISFAQQGATQSKELWQLVLPEPSIALWSSVTNPYIYVQFAWHPRDESLFQASIGVPLDEGLQAVAKLTIEDYRSFAEKFVSTLDTIDPSSRA